MASDDSGMRARKPKLAVEEQIAHLKSKGVTFDLCSEEEAAECLSDRTCHFKLAAYRVLFDKRVGGERDGEYVGLDFGHLRALDGHRQRLRARDPERRQDPERGRLGARGDRPEQAREALEDAGREGPADNDDGLRLQGARKGEPRQGDVPRADGRLHPQVGRAFGLVRPIGWLPLGARFPKQGA